MTRHALRIKKYIIHNCFICFHRRINVCVANSKSTNDNDNILHITNEQLNRHTIYNSTLTLTGSAISVVLPNPYARDICVKSALHKTDGKLSISTSDMTQVQYVTVGNG
jgi:hypothetical protein